MLLEQVREPEEDRGAFVGPHRTPGRERSTRRGHCRVDLGRPREDDLGLQLAVGGVVVRVGATTPSRDAVATDEESPRRDRIDQALGLHGHGFSSGCGRVQSTTSSRGVATSPDLAAS